MDEVGVRRVVEETDRRMSDVAVGRAEWQDVADRLSDVLPGSAISIVTYDWPSRAVLQTIYSNIERQRVESYQQYYAPKNPWLDYWDNAPSDVVLLSEEEYPVTLFRNSEFYVDWLGPQEHLASAAGIKINVGEGEIFHLSWHYRRDQAPSYDAAARKILEGTKASIQAGVEVARQIRGFAELGIREAALVDRSDEVAILVGLDRRIVDANQRAADAFIAEDLFVGRGNLLSLRNPDAQRWLDGLLADLANGRPLSKPSKVVPWRDTAVRVTAASLPAHGNSFARIPLAPRRLLLLSVRQLPTTRAQLDEEALRVAYGLSTAEIMLCQHLLDGRSLQEIAKLAAVSEGTIRQRVKSVFLKTRTHRQAELVALLARSRVMD
jgi:DNA-binding CsgD family transcriptional regulator/PAS domain-containing protein